MTDHLDYDSLRADTVRQVAKLMAAAAITAPKSGGQLLLAGKHLFIETVIVDDRETLSELAAWMRARGKARRHQGRHRRRALPLTHPQSNRLRPKDARHRLRQPRASRHRHPAARRARSGPRGWREKQTAAEASSAKKRPD